MGSFELGVLCFSLEYWCSKFEFLLFSCFYDHIEGVKYNSLIWIYRSLLHCYFQRCLIKWWICSLSFLLSHVCLPAKWVNLTALDSFVEDTLWTGTPGNYTNPHAPEALSVVRKLVDNGQYADATTAAEKLSHNPSDVCIILMHNLPFHFTNESYIIMLVGLPPSVEFKLIVILHYLPSIKISADLSGKQIKFAILIS